MIYLIAALIGCFIVYCLADVIGHNPNAPSLWTRIKKFRRSTRIDSSHSERAQGYLGTRDKP